MSLASVLAKVMLKSIRSLLLLSLVAGLCRVAEATVIGNTFTGATTPGYTTDGADVLNIETNQPVPRAGFINSYTFLGTTAGLGDPYGAGPYTYDFLVLHPTGTPDQYTVLFDSGPQQPTSVGIQTVAIPLVAVQAGDLIGDWGRGISFDIPGSQSALFYYDGSISATPVPTGTFTVGTGSYSLSGDRTYYVQATLVPEPSSVVLLACGSLLLCFLGTPRLRAATIHT